MELQELSPNKHKLPRILSLQRFFCLFNRFNIFDLLVIIICMASFGCSWIESTVNYDSLTWGGSYCAALDLMRGAKPHSEVFITYGYLSAWILSISLTLFGERLMSLGIITGLFYSLTLFLSYRVFLKFMSKYLAFIAVMLIFLIHPYIIYPAPNYVVYTFQLLALISLLRYSENRYNGFFAGFFLSMSFLSRYTSIQATLPPFIILLGWEFFTVQGTKKRIIEKIGIVSSGFIIPLIIFVIYLVMNSALDDFFYQTRMMIKEFGGVDNFDTYLNFLANIFLIETSRFAYDVRGKLFTLILIVCVFVISREIIRKLSGNPVKSAYSTYNILAVCLVSIFGYLNSVHIYETARLVNGASLGIGVVVFVFYNLFIHTIKPFKYLIVFFGILLCLFLSSSLFFKTTTSSYFPWRKDVLFHNGVTNKTIGIFKGKLLSKEYNDFYQEAFDAIAPFKDSCYILNYTLDCVAFSMNDLSRIQLGHIHLLWLDDMSKQEKLVAQHKAVILSYQPLELPGYKEIFKKYWPDEIPFVTTGGDYLFIYAPTRFVVDKQKISGYVDQH